MITRTSRSNAQLVSDFRAASYKKTRSHEFAARYMEVMLSNMLMDLPENARRKYVDMLEQAKG